MVAIMHFDSKRWYTNGRYCNPMTVVHDQYLNKGCSFMLHLKFKRLNNKLKSIDKWVLFLYIHLQDRTYRQYVIASESREEN